MSLASMIRRLVEAGYPESTARKIATGELPMDEASRMARAREQGFTTEAYHTGSPDILQFDPEKAVDERVGSGIWFSENPAIASGYAEDGSATYRVLLNTDNFGRAELNTGTWSNVGPFEYVTKTGETFDSQLIDDPFIMTTNELARFGRDQGDEGVIIEGLIDMGPNYKSMKRSLEGLEKMTGQTPQEFFDDYDIYGRTNYSSQNPSNARSYYSAAFDPDEIGNPNMMASRPEVGIASLMAADEFAEARAALAPEEGYQYYDILPIRKNLMGREQPYELALPNIVREPVNALLDLSEQLETGERNPAKAMGLLF
jgi:hypothetical protein